MVVGKPEICADWHYGRIRPKERRRLGFISDKTKVMSTLQGIGATITGIIGA